MKPLLFITLFFIAFLLACDKKVFSEKKPDTDCATPIVGKWKLVEYLVDPGNGSGTWQPAPQTDGGFLEFKADGELIKSGFNLSIRHDRYLIKDSVSLMLYNAGTTDSSALRYSFKNCKLELNPMCFEACGLRYVPVE